MVRTRLRCRVIAAGLKALLVLALAPLLAYAAPPPGDPAPLPPHQRVWRQWTVQQGLPQITVNALVRDRAGYLWLGTQDGLSRFDGQRFENFALRAHPGLGHAVVTALALDGDGALWIGTSGNLSRWTAGRITRVPVPGGDTGWVWGIDADARGGLWVSAENGLYRVERGVARPVPMPGGVRDSFASVLTAPDGTRRAVAVAGMLVDPVPAGGGSRARWQLFPKSLPGVLSATRGPDGALWLGTSGGVYRTDWNGRPLGPARLAGREVTAVRFDALGHAWAATDRGLWRLRPDGVDEPIVVPGLHANAWIGGLLVDAQDTLWVGSQLTGLHRAYEGRFRRFTARDGLVDDAVWSVYPAPDGELWVGTPQGLFRGGVGGFRRALPVDALPHPAVMSVFRDRAGTLWIGTYSGLARWPRGAARPATVQALGNATVSGMLEDRDGHLLLATTSGLLREDGGRFVRIALPGPDEGGGVSDLLFDRRGRLWVASTAGLAWRDGGRWHARAGTVVPSRRPLSLAAFDEGVLVTSLESLYYADPARLRVLGRDAGLHVDVAHSVVVTPREVWYQAAHGVGRIPATQLLDWLRGRRARLDVRVYGDLGGAEVAECNGGQQQSAALTGGRWLWCPSLQGLLALDLSRADALAPPAPARIERVVTPRARHAPGTRALALRADERDLQFDYTALDLRQPDELRFRGRLLGYDAAWKSLGARRSAFYTNLPAGDYAFEVQARNADGVYGPVARTGLSIAPRWFETALARVAAVVLAVLAAWGLLRWRVAALDGRRRLLEAEVRRRTAQLREANRKLEASSLSDALTGLHNRRFLLEQMPHEIARVDRTLHAPGAGGEHHHVLAFLHIDLDGFKQVNDAHGHHVGDQVLRIAADLLRANTRDADFVVRWGGEEFLVVARDITRADVAAWATRIVEGFRGHAFQTDAGALHVTCSVGHAVYPPMPAGSAMSWEDVLQMADAATYIAKRDGRDRSVGIELLRADVGEDFGGRLHQEPQRLAAEGWIRIDTP